jgi:hypothetical protein
MAIIQHLLVVSGTNVTVLKRVLEVGPGIADAFIFRATGDVTPGRSPAVKFGAACPFSNGGPQPNVVFKFDPAKPYTVTKKSTDFPAGTPGRDTMPFVCGEVDAGNTFHPWSSGGNGKDI